MLTPKRARLTARQEREAYECATMRDGGAEGHAGGLCVRCQRDCGRGVTSRDHRQRRDAFNTVPSNLQVLGGTGTTGCHGWKTKNSKAAIAEGWSVPAWAIPAEFPAARWISTGYGTLRQAWVLYDDFGSWREISSEEADQRRTGDWPGVAVAGGAR